MEDIVTFIISYWQLIILVILSVVESFFVVLLKRKPTYDLKAQQWVSVLNTIPKVVVEAEKKYGAGNGPAKLCYCLEYCVKRFPELFSDQKNLISLNLYIEDILEAPQRKEVYHGS